MEGVVCAVDEAEGEECDDHLPDGSDEEWTKALFAEVSEAGAETDSREGEQEGPAGEVADGQQLRLGEEPDCCE